MPCKGDKEKFPKISVIFTLCGVVGSKWRNCLFIAGRIHAPPAKFLHFFYIFISHEQMYMALCTAIFSDNRLKVKKA